MLTSVGCHIFKLSVTLGSPFVSDCLKTVSAERLPAVLTLLKITYVCVCLPRAVVPLLNLNSPGLSYH